MVIFSCSCKVEPLTEIEKIRARTMMSNNSMLRSLGLPALVNLLRNNYGVNREGSATTAESSMSSITQAESSDYDPCNEEVIYEQVDDCLVDTTVQVPLYLVWMVGISCLLFPFHVLLLHSVLAAFYYF